MVGSDSLLRKMRSCPLLWRDCWRPEGLLFGEVGREIEIDNPAAVWPFVSWHSAKRLLGFHSSSELSRFCLTD